MELHLGLIHICYFREKLDYCLDFWVMMNVYGKIDHAFLEMELYCEVSEVGLVVVQLLVLYIVFG